MSTPPLAPPPSPSASNSSSTAPIMPSDDTGNSNSLALNAQLTNETVRKAGAGSPEGSSGAFAVGGDIKADHNSTINVTHKLTTPKSTIWDVFQKAAFVTGTVAVIVAVVSQLKITQR